MDLEERWKENGKHKDERGQDKREGQDIRWLTLMEGVVVLSSRCLALDDYSILDQDFKSQLW